MGCKNVTHQSDSENTEKTEQEGGTNDDHELLAVGVLGIEIKQDGQGYMNLGLHICLIVLVTFGIL